MGASLLDSQPLWLGVTLGSFLLANHASSRWLRANPLANPVLLAMITLCTLVGVSGVGVQRYIEYTRPLTAMIGPATVALVIPLWNQRQRVRRAALPLLIALTVGCLTAYLVTLALSDLAGLSPQISVSLAPRSTTAPVAMALAEIRGGLPTVAMCSVMVSGIVGAVALTWLMRLMRIEDPAAVGFTAGLSAHALGVARSLELGPTQAAFAGVGMLLNALATSVLVAAILMVGLS